MARKQRNELAAGAFVIGCALTIVAVAIWLSGIEFGGRFVYLTAPLDSGDVSIVEGSVMKMGSLEVGKVVSVTADAKWQTFTFRVRLVRDVDIRRDAVVQTSSPTLGGVGTLIVLNPGSAESPPADEEHPAELSVGPNPLIRDIQRELGYGKDERTAFQNALAALDTLSTNLVEISGTFKAQLTPGAEPNMLSDAVATLKDLRETVATVKGQVAFLKGQLDPANTTGLFTRMQTSLIHANKITSEAAALVTNARPKLEAAAVSTASAAKHINAYAEKDLAKLLAGLRASSDKLLAMMKDFHEVSTTAREIVTVNQNNVDEMLANLTQVSVNLKAAARDIRRRPWRLLGKPSVEDIRSENVQNAALAFAEGAAELDDAIHRLDALSRATTRPGAPDDPQLKLVRQKIRDSFEKFTQVEQALWKELNK